MLRPISFPVVKAVLPFIFALVFAFAAAGSASDKPSDETIRSQIPGAWISQETLDGQPTTLTVEYRSDGTFGGSARMTEGRYSIKLVLTGTWRVHNGYLISHTEATGAPPRVTTHEVVAVNESNVSAARSGREHSGQAPCEIDGRDRVPTCLRCGRAQRCFLSSPFSRFRFFRSTKYQYSLAL